MQTKAEDGLDSYMSLLAILLIKEERLVPTHIHLGPLFARLDECVNNIVRLLARYVVTHGDTSFLQMFFWERFRSLS